MLTRYRSMYLGSQGKLCNWNISCACRTLIPGPHYNRRSIDIVALTLIHNLKSILCEVPYSLFLVSYFIVSRLFL